MMLHMIESYSDAYISICHLFFFKENFFLKKKEQNKHRNEGKDSLQMTELWRDQLAKLSFLRLTYGVSESVLLMSMEWEFENLGDHWIKKTKDDFEGFLLLIKWIMYK